MKFRKNNNSPLKLVEGLNKISPISLEYTADMIDDILNSDLVDLSEDERKILDAAYNVLWENAPHVKVQEGLKESSEVNLSDKSNSISSLLLNGKDLIDSASSQSELVKVCGDLLAEKGGAKAQQFLSVLKAKKNHYAALKYVYDFILAGEGMRSPDSQRKSKSVQRREALQRGENISESITEDELVTDGFERVTGRNGYDFYRKLVDGKGKWYAVKDGEVMPITYDQARGFEPINSDERMSMMLGKKLLPRQ